MNEEEKKIAESVEMEDNLSSLLGNITNEKFTLTEKIIKTSQIGISEPVKKGRQDTRRGLTRMIRELGVLSPIHVMTMEQSVEDEEEECTYMLLDGLRRLNGALVNNQETIKAIVWDFEDKDLGKRLALTLSLILNRTQKRSWKETWDLMQILELQASMTPNTLEYLLQLESGDSLKLKDCMLCEYPDVQEALISNQKTLDQCHKMLQKLRKEENAVEKEEQMGISKATEEGGEIANTEQTPTLSDDEVLELLEMGNDFSDDDIESGNVSLEDLDKSEEVRGVEQQKVGERHPVDPAIKQATLRRDNFTCQCCGTGGEAFIGVLVYHHKIPVHCGGKDTEDNGLTLCASCHITLHLYEMGKLVLSPQVFDNYSEKEKIRIKKIMKYGNIAIEAGKRKGLSREQIKEGAKSGTRHLMPGEGLKENMEALKKSK